MIDMQWLEMCATAGELMYGYYTVNVLKKMYEGRKGYKASVDELIRSMRELEKEGIVLMQYTPGSLDDTNGGPGFFAPTECEGTPLESVMREAQKAGNVYATLHLDEDERLNLMSEWPAGLEFYIPNESEITQLVGQGYIHTPEMARLEDLIKKQGGNGDYLKGLWPQVSTDKLDMMESVSSVISGMFRQIDERDDTKEGGKTQEDMKQPLPTIDDLNSMMPVVNDFLNSINLRARKGWRPNELFMKMHPNGLTSMPTIMPGSVSAAKSLRGSEAQLKAMGAKLDFSSIDNYVTTGAHGERRVMKVGRNDPCPCGSGKKYKHCYGR